MQFLTIERIGLSLFYFQTLDILWSSRIFLRVCLWISPNAVIVIFDKGKQKMRQLEVQPNYVWFCRIRKTDERRPIDAYVSFLGQ